jgi:hypothetical protein
LLVDAANRFGLSAVTEYAVPGSRIDVVWKWVPRQPIPGVESTRRFASQLVDRPGTRIVWSEEDVHALVTGDLEDLEELQAAEPLIAASAGPTEHRGKYRPLWEWLRTQTESPVTASFSQIERELGFTLPPSSRRHLPHWYGYTGTAVGRAIRDAGWRARHVDLDAESVVFERETTLEL